MKSKNNIEIIDRPLTTKEIKLVDDGFDALSREEGVALESTEKQCFVATQGGQLVGCATGLAHMNGDLYSGWFHLTDLFVTKEFRNQGLGSELLQALEEKICSIGVRNVWLWTSGEATLRFYERHGYQIFTAMENWYSDGSSRVGMRKGLASL